MKSRTLKRNVFNAIRKELLESDRAQYAIGADYGVSASSVSTVNVEGTWENHLVAKKAKRTLTQRRKAEVKAKTKVEQARTAGLHPHTKVDRDEEQIAINLEKLEATPTSVEFDTRNLIVNQRFKGILKELATMKKRDWTFIVQFAVLWFIQLLVLVLVIVEASK